MPSLIRRQNLQRFDRQSLSELLICPDCGGRALAANGTDSLTCSSCGTRHPMFRRRPVLMKQDNSLFPRTAYLDDGADKPDFTTSAKSGLGAKIKGLVPSRSINVARDRMLRIVAADCGQRPVKALVIGCGGQADDILRYFTGLPAQIAFCDIDKRADADVFCDSHDLPFVSGSFDLIITTAVIEHVLWPHKVADEIYRVLSPEGLLYSETPFLQAVHEGAYDFTRFTLGGHRLLFDRFDEIDSGIVAGPGTALVWAIVEFAKALSGNPKIARGLAMIAQTMFFPLKYADRRFAKRAKSADAASCTYFYGRRRGDSQEPASILDLYHSKQFTHL